MSLGWVIQHCLIPSWWQDSGIECLLSKFAGDTKLCGAIGTLEGKDAVQGDLDRLERWAHVKTTKINEAKCKVLSLGLCNAKHKHRLSREGIESSLRRRTRGCWWTRTSAWPSNVQNANHILVCLRSIVASRLGFGNSVPLLHSGEIPPGVMYSALWPPT